MCHRPARLVAPSYGFDLQLVLTHCLAARRLTLLRDGAICTLLFLTVGASPIALVISAIVLIVLQPAVAVLRFLCDLRAALRAEGDARFLRLLVRGFLLGIGLLFGMYAAPTLSAVAGAGLFSAIATSGSVAGRRTASCGSRAPGAGLGFLATPSAVVRSPRYLLRGLVDVLMSNADGQLELARSQGAGVDHGARVSIRELGADDVRTLSEWTDIRKVHRLVERRVLVAVLDFLDERGVDTTEFRVRAGAVLNIGVANVAGRPLVTARRSVRLLAG